MITEINNYTDFLLAEYQLILDLDTQMQQYLNSHKIIETNNSILIKNFLENASLEDQLGASKKILGNILTTLDNYENNLNIDLATNFISEQNNYFNLSLKLFGLTDKNFSEKANDIFVSFFKILFSHVNLTKEAFVFLAEPIIEEIDTLNINNENIFLQSIYNIFLRILLSKNAIISNKALTQKMVNVISPEITQKNIIHRIFYNNW